MFGDTDNVQTKTEENLNSEGCYGGFGNRFSYEQCRRAENSGFRRTRQVFLFVGIGFFAIFCGLLCAIVLVRIVETNRSLYFPSAVHSVRAVRAADNEEMLPLGEDVAVSTFERGSELVNVSKEDSKRYRIPVGVMIRSLDQNSEALALGLEIGDIIVSVNDVPVSDIDTLNSLVLEAPEAPVTVLEVFRDNSYYVISVASK